MIEVITPEKQVKFCQALEQAINDIYDYAYDKNNLYIDEVERIIITNLRKNFNDVDCSKIIGRSIRHMRQKHGPRNLQKNNNDL